jgi:Ca-activated chloride channel family protein
VFLSVLGFGTGNYQDAKMQQLADKGNGNHAYIDSILEARKVLGEEMSQTLVTIAKDVKIQLFFNPKRVAGFRLIGYENRLLAKQDFNDDTKDAGEIGAGHCVTALYELVPVGTEVPAAPAADENPFVAKAGLDADSAALFQLRLRYKQPDGDKSELLEQMVVDGDGTFDKASPDFRWAAAVAAFGMNLRGTAGMGLDAVLEIAKGAAGEDKYRREFLELVQTAKLLSPLTSGFLGVINGVRGNLVGISAGSEEGVRIGDILSLSRGAEYVGRVVITSVDKKQSVGEFDTQFPGNGAPPQVGDKALLSR